MIKINLLLCFLTGSLLFTALGQSDSCRSQEGVNSIMPVGTTERLATGIWGGDRIRLEVSDSGAAVEYECAHSTIDQPIVLDREGNFDVTGTYTREHGGPMRIDRMPPSLPARYVGRARGSTLTLTVTLPETEETIGTFTLAQGRDVVLRKCR